MRKQIEQSWQRRNGLAILLWPLSQLYKAIMLLRKKAYEYNLFSSYALPVPTIVVGNLSVGGTGKTPVVIELVRYLQEQGYRPAVITRGYGGANDGQPFLVEHDTQATYCGDEARLIYEQTSVPVSVCSDRVAAAKYVLNKYDVNVIISDDGYQHFRLKRDVDIVVVDGRRGFGNGWCLPAGFLREPLSQLARAHAIVVNGSPTQKLQQQLTDYPVYQMQMHLSEAYCLADGQKRSLSEFAHGKVHAVAAIGNPGRFFSALKKAGLRLHEHPFDDHYAFVESDLFFADDLPILLTQKDAVKCQYWLYSTVNKIWVVPASVTLEPSFMQKIQQLIKEKQI